MKPSELPQTSVVSVKPLSVHLGNDLFASPISLLLLGHACSCAVTAVGFCIAGVGLQCSICVLAGWGKCHGTEGMSR